MPKEEWRQSIPISNPRWWVICPIFHPLHQIIGGKPEKLIIFAEPEAFQTHPGTMGS